MALTRAQVESILVRRIGGIMTEAGLDGTTVDGSNADLNDPIGYSIRQLGGSVANIAAVADVDLAGIGADDYDQLLDVAELRALQSTLSNLVLVDIKIGPRDEKKNQLAQRLEKLIAMKQKAADSQYGLTVSTVTATTLNLNFVEHDLDNIDELGR